MWDKDRALVLRIDGDAQEIERVRAFVEGYAAALKNEKLELQVKAPKTTRALDPVMTTLLVSTASGFLSRAAYDGLATAVKAALKAWGSRAVVAQETPEP